jgi:adenylate kinase
MALPEGSDRATSATSAGSAATRLRALLLGDPGAGKSTQANELARIYGVPHVSMGELLREHGTEKTAAGQRVAREVAAGELVPDSLVIEVLLRYLTRSNAKDSYVLDGFPRTLAQAESWQEQGLRLGCAPSIAIWLVVPRTELLTRLRDRRVRIGRPDDADEGISRRLTISLQSRELLQGFYRQLGILSEVDGSGSVEDVAGRVRRAAGAVVPPPAR